jgi:hypothetical protein
MEALSAFIAAVPWGAVGPIPVRLTTHMADNDPAKRNQMSSDRQQAEIVARLAAMPALTPDVKYHHSKYDPLHMRYAYFELADGERLYVFERGLDIADLRSGKARDDSYILEFENVPAGLAPVLKLPPRPA